MKRAEHRRKASKQSAVTEPFRTLASGAARHLGSPWAFAAAVVLVVGWAVSGPFFHFSHAWQLVIHTGTTIITFLMVFLIQATENLDAKALHLKLDELIRSTNARNMFADLENATEDELDALQHEFECLRRDAGARRKRHATHKRKPPEDGEPRHPAATR